jgi:hypothetical protein
VVEIEKKKEEGAVLDVICVSFEALLSLGSP